MSQSNAEDIRIRDAIMARLHEHPQLDEKGIVVTVTEGKVVLTGKSDTDKEKEMAGNLAASVDGVKEIENHLHTGMGIAHALSVFASELTSATKENKEPPPPAKEPQ